MTQIDRDCDPVTNVIGRATFETRRAEGIVRSRVYDGSEPSTDSTYRDIPIGVEAKHNGHDNLTLTTYAWLGCSVSQYFDSALNLALTFEEVVDEYDLEEVEEFSDVEDLEGSA